MKIKMVEKFGKRIFRQEDGTKLADVAIDYFKKNNKKIILDFDNVQSVNTAFFNGFLSRIYIKKMKTEKLKNFFSLQNANETTKNAFAISIQLLDYYE